MKRLFLFAGYDRDGIVDDSLLYYLNALSALGDIVFVMDNDATDTEIARVKQIPNVLYANAARHGEYDFGSYKRAYIWARDNNILEKYDWIYLVNDSVLGPLFDIKPILDDLESRRVDLTGIVSYQEKVIANHIQSWFVGLSQRVATATFFDEFMCSVKHEDSKPMICAKYEIQLSRRILQHGYKMYACFDTEQYLSDNCHLMYHEPLQALKLGIPFIKKQIAPKIIDNFLLYQYVESDCLLSMFQRSAAKVPPIPRKKLLYKPVLRLRIFGIQAVKIYKVVDTFGSSAEIKYRIEIFGCIPFMFIHKNKHAK